MACDRPTGEQVNFAFALCGSAGPISFGATPNPAFRSQLPLSSLVPHQPWCFTQHQAHRWGEWRLKAWMLASQMLLIPLSGWSQTPPPA